MAEAFRGLRLETLERIARTLARSERCQHSDADDAVQEAAMELWRQREVLRQPIANSLELLFGFARMCLRRNRAPGPTTALSIEALAATRGDGPLQEARLLVAESFGIECRHVRAPGAGEEWLREQIIGAIQRFCDFHGRPPGSRDFKAINGLPSRSILRRHFATQSAALLAAGIDPASRQAWPPVPTARTCRYFRRRNLRWPSGSDIARDPYLPPRDAMRRWLGGTDAAQVQLGAEAILEAVGEPTA